MMDNDQDNVTNNNRLVLMTESVADKFSDYEGEMSDDSIGLTAIENRIFQEALEL